MEKDKALEKINASDSNDFEVFTKDEHTTYLENFKKQEVDPLVSKSVSEIHKRYDDDMFELFGERKENDEKTYNFLKRKVTELKTQTGESEKLQNKIKELEETIKNGNGDELLKKQLEEVREKYKEEQEGWKEKEKEFLTTIETNKLDMELDKAMIGLKFKDDISQDIKDVFIGKVKADLIKNARFVDNTLVFVGEDGQTLVNKENALNPYTAKEMMEKNLEGILTKVEKQNGPPKPKTKIVDGNEVIDLPDPQAKTREEVTQYLIDNGVPRNSKRYGELYKDFTKGLPKLT